MGNLVDLVFEFGIPFFIIGVSVSTIIKTRTRRPRSRTSYVSGSGVADDDVTHSMFEDTNPATGLPLTCGIGSMDVGGNSYGESSHSSFSHDSDLFSHDSGSSSYSSFNQD